MSTDSAILDGPKSQGRSRISNGNGVFLEGVDGRCVLARRYRDILASLVSDLAGDPSEAQSLIARRSATLAVWCELAEARMAKGDDLDIGEFTTATNALRRLLADLGLERRARDVTPSLADIAAQIEADKEFAA
jgi:hypothetical protein